MPTGLFQREILTKRKKFAILTIKVFSVSAKGRAQTDGGKRYAEKSENTFGHGRDF